MRTALALAACCTLHWACAGAQPNPAKEKKNMTADAHLEAKIEAGEQGVAVKYALTNTGTKPMLVFDRLWDNEKGALDPNWAYVEIRSGRALVKRAMETPPPGLHVEMPAVPYGREIAPGGKAEGSFTLAAPLTERGAYDAFTHPSKEFSDSHVSAVGFALAWGYKPDPLPPAFKPVDVNGEKLLLLDKGMVGAIQQIAAAEPVMAVVPARARK